MGCFDIFCVLCGCPPHDMSGWSYGSASESPSRSDESTISENEYSDIIATTEWMGYCTILLTDGRIIHDLWERACNIDFENADGDEYTYYPLTGIYNVLEPTNVGIFIHSDCHKYAKKLLGIDLSFHHFPQHRFSEFGHAIDDVKYGDIEDYWGQDLDFPGILNNNHEWMLISPLIKSKNQQRIIKVLSQFKLTKSEIKKRATRPSPVISATMVPNNACMLGQNNKIWKKSRGKWVPVDSIHKTMTLTKTRRQSRRRVQRGNDYIYHKEQMGDCEKDLVFIVKNSGKTIEVVGTPSGIDKLEKKIK